MMSKTVKPCGLERDEEWTHDGGDSVKDDQEKEEEEKEEKRTRLV